MRVTLAMSLRPHRPPAGRHRHLRGAALALALLAASPAIAAPPSEPQPTEAPPTESPRAPRGGTWTLQAENDSISTTPGGSDKFYSNGLRLGWTSAPGDVPQFAADLARWVWGDGTTRISLNLTHQIYTPTDTERATPDPSDRPLAGYLAATFAILQDKADSRSVMALSVGTIGPSSLGRQVQNEFHKLLRIRINNGWDGQLPDEPQVQFLAERTWRMPLLQAAGLETDMLPSLTAGLGTVRDYVQAGIVLRLGQGLQRDFGVARIRPGVTGGDAFAPSQDLSWYVFAGVNGQAVARDVFLNGTLWRSSPSVRHNWMVGGFEAGLAIIWRDVRISYTQTWETAAFKGQRGGLFNFGSLAVSMAF